MNKYQIGLLILGVQGFYINNMGRNLVIQEQRDEPRDAKEGTRGTGTQTAQERYHPKGKSSGSG